MRKFPHAPILILPDIISKDMCRTLIDYWERGTKTESAVASADGAAVQNARIKIRDDVHITDPMLTRQLLESFAKRVIPAVNEVFHYQITQWEGLRVGCYDSKDRGFFGPHRDNTTPFTAHRHFALTLNLNLGEYKGGSLRFPDFMGGPFDAPTGGGCIFSCDLLHEALPVTRGRRFGVFCFFYNEAGLAHQRKVQEEAKRRTATPAPAV